MRFNDDIYSHLGGFWCEWNEKNNKLISHSKYGFHKWLDYGINNHWKTIIKPKHFIEKKIIKSKYYVTSYAVFYRLIVPRSRKCQTENILLLMGNQEETNKNIVKTL